MPANQFNCPSCNTLLRLAEPLPAGTKVKCPKCGTIFGAEEAPIPVEPVGSEARQFTPRDAVPRVAPQPAPPPPSPRYGEYEGDEEDLYGESAGGTRLPRREYRVEIGRWFDYASSHYGSVFGPMIGYMLILIGLGFVLGFIPVIGLLINLILQPALQAGLIAVPLAQLKGKRWDFGHFFSGFQMFGTLLLNGILSLLVAFACMVPGALVLGLSIAAAAAKMPFFLLLGIPALLANLLLVLVYVWVPLWMFCYPLILERKLGPVEAMQASWTLARGHSWGLFGMGCLCFLINLGGASMCGIGALFTTPYTRLVQTAGYLLIAGKKRPVEARPYPHETDYQRRDLNEPADYR
jgi:hypothetical protein